MRAQLGVGLIRIGRVWGHVPQPVPSEREALAFLEHAARAGIRYYDTAPSYGTSQRRLGIFLRSLPDATRQGLTIATKFGEHWDPVRQEPFVDHSFDALRRSLDESLELLGPIDVLQLHKTTPAALGSEDLARAWDYASSLGIAQLGVSVSDLESARLAIAGARYSAIQLPLNALNRTFQAVADAASQRGMQVVANRPYGMGAMLSGETPLSKEDAFAYLLQRNFSGVILTGTASIAHLDENLAAFNAAARC